MKVRTNRACLGCIQNAERNWDSDDSSGASASNNEYITCPLDKVKYQIKELHISSRIHQFALLKKLHEELIAIPYVETEDGISADQEMLAVEKKCLKFQSDDMIYDKEYKRTCSCRKSKQLCCCSNCYPRRDPGASEQCCPMCPSLR